MASNREATQRSDIMTEAFDLYEALHCTKQIAMVNNNDRAIAFGAAQEHGAYAAGIFATASDLRDALRGLLTIAASVARDADEAAHIAEVKSALDTNRSAVVEEDAVDILSSHAADDYCWELENDNLLFTNIG